MFHSFLLTKSDCDYTRFFWYKNNDSKEKLVQYRACVHVFGNKPSPSIANHGLRYAAVNSPVECSSGAQEFIENQFYVDDAWGTADSVEEAVALLKDIQKLLRYYHIDFLKISSNSESVLKEFPDSDLNKIVVNAQSGNVICNALIYTHLWYELTQCRN